MSRSNTDAAGAKYGAEIDFEHGSFDERDIFGKAWPQLGDQITIDFHCGDVRRARRQFQRQRTGAGADFQKHIVRRRIDSLQHLVDPDGLEEVLADKKLEKDLLDFDEEL